MDNIEDKLLHNLRGLCPLVIQAIVDHGELGTGKHEISNSDLLTYLKWDAYKLSRVINGRDRIGGLKSKVWGLETKKQTKRYGSIESESITVPNLMIYLPIQTDPFKQYGRLVELLPE